MTRRHSFRTTTRFTTALIALAFGLLGAACNEYPLHDLGYTNGNLSGEGDDPDAPLPPVAEFASEFAGVWIGEAEDPLALQNGADDSPPAYRFPSGSKRIRLELATDTFGSLYPTGTLTFGQATPPPPPTNPDLGYPVDPNFDVNLDGASDFSVRPPIEGFAHYASPIAAPRDFGAAGLTSEDSVTFLDEGRVVDGKLELSYVPTEVFGAWCALQTEATCSPSQFGWSDDGSECTFGDDFTPVDCQKAALCAARVCECFDGGCSYAAQQSSQLLIRFSDDGLVGLFSNAVFVNERGFQQPLGTVHFSRETP